MPISSAVSVRQYVWIAAAVLSVFASGESIPLPLSYEGDLPGDRALIRIFNGEYYRSLWDYGVLDLRTGKFNILKIQKKEFHSFRLSDDGKTAASFEENGSYNLYDFSTSSTMITHGKHPLVYSPKFNNDASSLIFGMLDRVAGEKDAYVASYQLLELKNFASDYAKSKWDPIELTDYELPILRADTSRKSRSFSPVVAVSPDGSKVIYGVDIPYPYSELRLYEWDMSTHKTRALGVFDKKSASPFRLEWIRKDTLLACGATYGPVPGPGTYLMEMDLSSAQPKTSIPGLTFFSTYRGASTCGGLSYSSDGRYVAYESHTSPSQYSIADLDKKPPVQYSIVAGSDIKLTKDTVVVGVDVGKLQKYFYRTKIDAFIGAADTSNTIDVNKVIQISKGELFGTPMSTEPAPTSMKELLQSFKWAKTEIGSFGGIEICSLSVMPVFENTTVDQYFQFKRSPMSLQVSLFDEQGNELSIRNTSVSNADNGGPQFAGPNKTVAGPSASIELSKKSCLTRDGKIKVIKVKTQLQMGNDVMSQASEAEVR